MPRSSQFNLLPMQVLIHPFSSWCAYRLTLRLFQMQWPVYALAEAGAEIIRTHYNGVADPFGPPNSGGGGGNNNNKPNNNGTNTQHSGASSSTTPSVVTAIVTFLFAAVAALL